MKFLFWFPIESIEGRILAVVDAESEKAAKLLVKADRSATPILEEYLVKKLGKPEFLGEARTDLAIPKGA